jgi:putative transposase
MYLAQKIELEPTEKQKQEFQKYFGFSRYLYNKGLDIWKKMWEEYKEDKTKIKPNVFTVTSALRKEKEEWWKEYSGQIVESSMKNLAKGYSCFMKQCQKNIAPPNYKTKKKTKQSVKFFRKNERTFSIRNEKFLQLPGVYSKVGLIKMKEKIRFDVDYTIQEIVISYRAGKYFASIVMTSDKNPYKQISKKNKDFCGVDVGIKHPAVVYDSNGEIIIQERDDKELKRLEKKAKYYQKKMDRIITESLKTKKPLTQSKNFQKTKIKSQKVWMKIEEIREHQVHEITSYLVQNYRYICIEDLKSSNLQKNRHLAKSVGESMFYEFRRQLEYKSKYYGNTLIIVDRFFPSTQICSECGHRKEGENKLKLKQNTYRCKKCGYHENRDINAARNLMKYGQEFIKHQNV